jgi:hypothetical protein
VADRHLLVLLSFAACLFKKLRIEGAWVKIAHLKCFRSAMQIGKYDRDVAAKIPDNL